MSTSVKHLNRVSLNARFHQLLTQRNCDKDEKMSIVNQASNGEFTSSRDLSNSQLLEAIKLLEGDQNKSIQRMRAKAINLAKELGILPKEVKLPEHWKGLNTFTEKTFKKPFPKLSYDELRNCITGLENWQKNRHDKAIKELLS